MSAPDSVTVRAHAKVNLRLRVFARDESGYHGVETLYLRVDLADRVTLEPGGSGIEVVRAGGSDAARPATGQGAGNRGGGRRTPAVPDDRSNLAWRAAEAYARAAGEDLEAADGADPGVGVRLEKRIPAGAGLGGGSADAAAVLRGLDRLYGAVPGDELFSLAGRIGSDVPFLLQPADFALGWERGRCLLPLEAPPSRPGLLLVPPVRVATPEAYRWLDEARAERGSAEASVRPGEPGGAGREGDVAPAETTVLLPPAREIGRWEHLDRLAANDFEPVVFDRHPELAEARDELRRAGADLALLAGSGSSVFGLFAGEDERDRAAERWRESDVPAVPFRTLGEEAGGG